jgi:hypothetical protein
MPSTFCLAKPNRTIFKISHWINKQQRTIYVFVGNQVPSNVHAILTKCESPDGKLSAKESEALERVFGARYQKKLAINKRTKSTTLRFVLETIYVDDTIQTLKKKLYTYLSGLQNQQLYFWIKKETGKTNAIAANFVRHLFRDRSTLSPEEFAAAFKNYTGSELKVHDESAVLRPEEAYKTFMKQDMSFVYESLGFKYMKDKHFVFIAANPLEQQDQVITHALKYLAPDISLDESIILEAHYPIYENTIHMITDAQVSRDESYTRIYFPYQDRSLIDNATISEQVKVNDHIENVIQNEIFDAFDAINTRCRLGYLQLRSNEHSTVNIDLADLFSNFQTGTSVPLALYNSAIAHPTLKLYKPFVGESKDGSENIDRVLDWMTTKQKSHSNKEFILFKLLTRAGFYITIHLFKNGMYDLKYHMLHSYNFSNLNEINKSFEDVNSFIRSINTLLRNYQKAVDLPFMTTQFWENPNTGQTRIIRLQTRLYITFDSGNSSKKLAPSQTKVAGLIELMYPYFSAMPNGSKQTHLVFKKTSHFSKDDQVYGFFSRNKREAVKDVIEKCHKQFGISKKEAQKFYDDWKESPFERTVSPFIFGTKPVIVRLERTQVGYEADINNIRSLSTLSRLLYVLKRTMALALTDGSSKKLTIKVNEKLIEQIKKENEAFVQYYDNEANEDDDDAWILSDDDDEMPPSKQPGNANANGNDAVKAANTNAANANAANTYHANAQSNTGKDPKNITLKLLQDADPILFKFKATKGYLPYATQCGWRQGRQPIVISKSEKEALDAVDEGIGKPSYNYALQYGSTPERRDNNFYICPEVWCPVSRVSMTVDQYNNGRRCPREGEEPKNFMEIGYWAAPQSSKGKKVKQERSRYPGFLPKDKHPTAKHCMPCCFLKQIKEEDRRKCENIKEASNTIANADDSNDPSTGSNKYLKNNFPVAKNRFGLLPESFRHLLGSTQCGDRKDGSGHLKGSGNCFVRFGIETSASQTFLESVRELLYPKLSTSQLVDMILQDMSIQTFVRLHGGETVKHFIENTNDIWNSEKFQAFTSWFGQQTDYIRAFNLLEVWNDVKNKASFEPIAPLNRAVRREFQIYKAYINFRSYLADSSKVQDHQWLVDYWNNDVNKPNVIVFEYDGIDVYYSCSWHKGRNHLLKKTMPVVMIFKKGSFYEPIQEITFSKSKQMLIKKSFAYNADAVVRRLHSLMKKACGNLHKSIADALRIYINETKSAIKYHVIDAHFRLMGFITGDNVYLPLPLPEDMIPLENNETVVYIDRILQNIKPEVSKQHILNLLQTLNTEFKGAFELDVDKNKDKLNVLHLTHSRFVPLERLELRSKELEPFTDDHEIYLGTYVDDPRLSVTTESQQNEYLYKLFKGEVLSVIPYHSDFHQTLQVLWHPLNPYPSKVKRKVVHDIVTMFKSNLLIEKSKALSSAMPSKEAMDVKNKGKCSSHLSRVNCTDTLFCSWIEQLNSGGKLINGRCKVRIPMQKLNVFIERLVDEILRSRSLHYEQIVAHSSFDPKTQIAIVFEPKYQNKDELFRAIQQELYGMSQTVLNMTDANSIDVKNADLKSLKLPLMAQTMSYTKVPNNWKSLSALGFEVCVMDNTKVMLLDLFSRVIKRTRIGVKLQPQQLHTMLVERLLKMMRRKDAEYVGKAPLNTRFVQLLKEVDSNDELAVTSTRYEYGDLDLRILGDITNVNVLVIGHQCSKWDYMRCLNKKPYKHFVLLKHQKNSDTKCELYQLIVKNRTDWLFTADDFDDSFKHLIVSKCQEYYGTSK